MARIRGFIAFAPGSDCTDGENPSAGLVQPTDGNFYGTTTYGGAHGTGTVFKITSNGKLTTLHSFDPGGYWDSVNSDGSYPYAALVQATNGNLYGTTNGGGAGGGGTVFEITSNGTLTTLYNFCTVGPYCVDSAYPFAGLIQATDGNLYGTTYYGGDPVSTGPSGGEGTVFKITTNGTYTRLYSFCSGSDCTDGENPYAGLIQATDGNFYGTTTGGASGNGTVFKITSSGTLTTLHSFDGADGSAPQAALVQAINGNLYGTTEGGGANGTGTVFSLSVGLGPFVETLPTSGMVRAAVKILGTNLAGATRVSFNGTAARFTVASGSEITTTVPAGATTGRVQVVTPGGTLSSNVPFRVTVCDK